MQQDEQGWQFSPGVSVCHECLSDHELAVFVRDTATEYECSFCNRTSRKKPRSIPFDDLMTVIGDTLRQYYDRAVNALGWEGGYIGTTYDADDLIQDLDISENESVLQAIRDALGDEEWCDENPYGISGVEAYESAWEHFCHAVKHDTRYFFSNRDHSDDLDVTPVGKVLREISGIVEEQELITTAPTTALFHRVRVHPPSERCNDWRALGSPPPARAPSNRMSAAGISMFYASTTAQTAIAEARATLSPGKPARLTIAAWWPTRPLRLLDLTCLPPIPSFWFCARYARDRVRFLHSFTENITQPVVHDGREHIEYVPTQILTEYFRHEYRTDGARLDGIIYPSAKTPKGKNTVIFANQADLTPTAERTFSNDSPLLTLDTTSIKRLRNTRK